jgi:hypothetical protein
VTPAGLVVIEGRAADESVRPPSIIVPAFAPASARSLGVLARWGVL